MTTSQSITQSSVTVCYLRSSSRHTTCIKTKRAERAVPQKNGVIQCGRQAKKSVKRFLTRLMNGMKRSRRGGGGEVGDWGRGRGVALLDENYVRFGKQTRNCHRSKRRFIAVPVTLATEENVEACHGGELCAFLQT
ncbi:hypothetical protein J6590_033414 [Homalodisca vitripennis]|nr:hypothetical protein J6590_033414 [Homalodisca vitripennis]